MKKKERYWMDLNRQVVRGRFYSLAEPGEIVPVYNLCTIDYASFKITKRGKTKRGDVDKANLLETLYNEKLLEKEAGVRKRKAQGNGLNEADNHTVAEAIQKFQTEYLPTKSRSTQASYGNSLKYWSKLFGSKKLSELDEDEIQIARDELTGSGLANSTLNRYIAALSSMITVCTEDYKWCRKYEIKDGARVKTGNMINPCKSIKQRKEPDSRVRFLLPEESKRLLKACQPDLKDAVMLSLLTGARKSEIWNLRFDSVNLEKKVVSFWHTKNNKPRSVPLYGDSFLILQRRFEALEGRSEWVFPRNTNFSKPKSFSDQWYKALDKSGLEDFHYHDLRHTAASYMVMAGVTLSAVSEILGHSDIMMTFRYAHLAPTHLQGAMELLGEEILRITT
jgi:integrase